jgi:hypothetical protein
MAECHPPPLFLQVFILRGLGPAKWMRWFAIAAAAFMQVVVTGNSALGEETDIRSTTALLGGDGQLRRPSQTRGPLGKCSNNMIRVGRTIGDAEFFRPELQSFGAPTKHASHAKRSPCAQHFASVTSILPYL